MDEKIYRVIVLGNKLSQAPSLYCRVRDQDEAVQLAEKLSRQQNQRVYIAADNKYLNRCGFEGIGYPW